MGIPQYQVFDKTRAVGLKKMVVDTNVSKPVHGYMTPLFAVIRIWYTVRQHSVSTCHQSITVSVHNNQSSVSIRGGNMTGQLTLTFSRLNSTKLRTYNGNNKSIMGKWSAADTSNYYGVKNVRTLVNNTAVNMVTGELQWLRTCTRVGPKVSGLTNFLR